MSYIYSENARRGHEQRAESFADINRVRRAEGTESFDGRLLEKVYRLFSHSDIEVMYDALAPVVDILNEMAAHLGEDLDYQEVPERDPEEDNDDL